MSGGAFTGICTFRGPLPLSPHAAVLNVTLQRSVAYALRCRVRSTSERSKCSASRTGAPGRPLHAHIPVKCHTSMGVDFYMHGEDISSPDFNRGKVKQPKDDCGEGWNSVGKQRRQHYW